MTGPLSVAVVGMEKNLKLFKVNFYLMNTQSSLTISLRCTIQTHTSIVRVVECLFQIVVLVNIKYCFVQFDVDQMRKRVYF